MNRTRTFYVVYTYQSHPNGAQSIQSSKITITNSAQLTMDTVTSMRETIADDVGAPRESLVITFFHELEG